MRSARVSGAIAAACLSVFCYALVEAAGLGITVHQVDSSQFPGVRAVISVTNDLGVRIADLESDPSALEVLEDGQPVTGLKVEPMVDKAEPIAVALVVDVSGSMAAEAKLDAAKEAMLAFIDTLGPADAAAVISFSTETRIVQGYTADKTALKSAVNQLTPKGDTDLYGAVTQSAQLIGALPQAQRAILLISDGEDTVKRQSLEGSIQAARTAKTAIYAIGLGKDAVGGPLKDALQKLSTDTGGQATFVPNPADLKTSFVKVGEQFRRRYVLQYVSKLPGDDKPHELTIRARKAALTGEAKAQFVAKLVPLTFDVTGLSDATSVTGLIRIQVNVKTGAAQQVELIVDDKSRTSAGSPFALQWNTAAETPGLHKVIVRAKDSVGSAIDRSFVVDVVPPATAVPTATTIPTATAVPTPTPSPTPVPEPAPAPPPDYTVLYAIGGILGIAVIAAGAILAVKRRRSLSELRLSELAEQARQREASQTVDKSDSDIEPPEPLVVAPPPPPQPRASLRISHHGSEWDYVAEQPQILIGRESNCDIVIKDPLASGRHARLVAIDGAFWLEDMKSLSGTRVNGQITDRHLLATGDQVRIGDALVVFSAVPQPPDPVAQEDPG